MTEIIDKIFEGKFGLSVMAKFKVGRKLVIITAPEGGGGPDEAWVVTKDILRKLKIAKREEADNILMEAKVADWGYY